MNPLFKKSKKSKDKEVVNVDEDSVDFELVLESSTEEDIEKPGNMNLTEAEDASITSMTGRVDFLILRNGKDSFEPYNGDFRVIISGDQ